MAGTVEASTTCPCGKALNFSAQVPTALAQKSRTLTCAECGSKFLATVKRKVSKGEIVFEILDLSEKACDALRANGST